MATSVIDCKKGDTPASTNTSTIALPTEHKEQQPSIITLQLPEHADPLYVNASDWLLCDDDSIPAGERLWSIKIPIHAIVAVIATGRQSEGGKHEYYIDVITGKRYHIYSKRNWDELTQHLFDPLGRD